MDILQNLDLLSVGVSTAAMVILGFVLYFSDRTRPVNKAFFLLAISASVWSLLNYFSYKVVGAVISIWLIRSVLFFAVIFAYFLFRLMHALPDENVKTTKFHRFVVLPSVAISLILTTTNLVITSIKESTPDGVTTSFSTDIGIYFFGLTVLTLLISGIVTLLVKTVKAQGNAKKQFKVIFPGFFITIALILIFNFYLPAFLNISTYVPLGAVFILPFIAFTFYAIFKHKLFNIKDVTTMFIAFALTVTTFLEIIYSTNYTQTMFRSGIFLLVLIFSIQLIRSMINLEKANEKLKSLDQLKSEFVSLATHQIRAPLSAIKGYLSEVFDGDFGPISAEMEKPLRIVSQSTENLVNIVGDFLNISRIEQGNMKYELAPVDLKKLVDESISELKPNLERAGLSMQFDAPENSYEVYADIGKVKQVIGNLIDNSMKYTPHGGIKISLTSKPEKKKVLLAINDTGIGVPAEVIPKLFQKFTRAKGANEVNIIGTGLGLYVARLMIEGQNGRIWVESPGAGKGSTFYVELPMK